MKVINLFGSPGSCKSTLAAGLFFLMKNAGYKVELVTEYAKDMVYENRTNILSDQLYILAKQNRRLSRLKDSVDYVVTDSPLLLSNIYSPNSLIFNSLVTSIYNSYDNISIFLPLNQDKYQQYGRTQTVNESLEISNKIKDLIDFDLVIGALVPRNSFLTIISAFLSSKSIGIHL